MDKAISLRINKHKVATFFGNLSVLSIILSFYFYLLAEIAFNINSFRPLLLLTGYAFFIVGLIFNPKLKIDSQLFFYLIASILIFIISSPFWLNSFDINIYLSPITAIVIINNYDYFLRVMKVFIILTLILAFYEFINQEYLFVVLRDTFFGYRPLDEKFYGGYSGIFRSKVYFEGPLALSQFAIGTALIFRKNVKMLYIILLISIIANGRLGIVFCGIILATYYFKKYNLASILLRPKSILLLISGFFGVFLALYFLLDKTSIDRLKEAFDVSNEGNSERINFWIRGFDMLLNYDFLNLIFGNNGAFVNEYKNNAENGWLTLLLNNGILGFMYYAIPVFLIAVNSIKKSPINSVYILVLVGSMFVQTFHLGASANLIYWLVIYSFYKKNTSNAEI
ncbi:hypothetical protein [Bizionia sp. M204]|uniref:hypothetical protein n=1 Tax=Bizionia sp. M204 TaxID=2675331 RepID=UPI00206CDE76|nr:hypothetical protein [Bizionia sp. M204]UPS92549.1 hypothetical protein GMA17_12800 [Bizionia sp. M204]